MPTRELTGSVSSSDRRTAKLLRWAPWFSFAVLTSAPTLFFLFFYFASAADAAVYLLLAMTSLVLGSASGLIVAIAFLFYRRHWAGRLRERLAADGITGSEIPWFTGELTSLERRALKQIQHQSPLLADAYSETLAIRLNATRLVTSARRELLEIRQRINRAARIQGADTSVLLEDLQQDRARLEGVQQEGQRSLSEAEARLQTIEAAASRGSGWTETNYMLQRLNEGHANVPMALEAARIEQQIREDTERELRDSRRQAPM
ncbi:MAG: hypothetical protein ABJC05_01970 [Pyrinomonadaceae bacterium]